LAAALAVTHLMASLVYGVKSMDPLIYGSSTLVALLVALAATLIPAQKAARVNPMAALRYE